MHAGRGRELSGSSHCLPGAVFLLLAGSRRACSNEVGAAGDGGPVRPLGVRCGVRRPRILCAERELLVLLLGVVRPRGPPAGGNRSSSSDRYRPAALLPRVALGRARNMHSRAKRCHRPLWCAVCAQKVYKEGTADALGTAIEANTTLRFLPPHHQRSSGDAHMPKRTLQRPEDSEYLQDETRRRSGGPGSDRGNPPARGGQA